MTEVLDRAQSDLQLAGITHAQDTGKIITLTYRDMLWLPEDSTDVHLAAVTFARGGEVFVGSAVRGRLVEPTLAADSEGRGISNRQFLIGVKNVAEHERGIEVLPTDAILHTIYSLNRGGVARDGAQRRMINTYFMGLAGAEIPTFIKVVSTTKKQENEVRKVLQHTARRRR